MSHAVYRGLVPLLFGNWPKARCTDSTLHAFSFHNSSQSPGVLHSPPWWSRWPRKLWRQRPTLCISRLSFSRRTWANRRQQAAGRLTTWAPSSGTAAPWLLFSCGVWALSLVSSKKENRVRTGPQVFRGKEEEGAHWRGSGYSSSRGHYVWGPLLFTSVFYSPLSPWCLVQWYSTWEYSVHFDGINDSKLPLPDLRSIVDMRTHQGN